jgi:hypothetical protein
MITWLEDCIMLVQSCARPCLQVRPGLCRAGLFYMREANINNSFVPPIYTRCVSWCLFGDHTVSVAKEKPEMQKAIQHLHDIFLEGTGPQHSPVRSFHVSL